ncbi:hypothetical protein CY34DRAFT_808555 [Suillus luteus UH-Slu-Lm8-n1]|uniref:Uncharacterized protein n=1 Tax=Suillus luteus UH-Slu-Lm8-n1 TaxID=930992 RepID=A0A0D0ABM9_9AGAM|nr:hypothetical protein CY34DRAFT_808555 [Suillus luteus UH-Slu-Lm8-n1]
MQQILSLLAPQMRSQNSVFRDDMLSAGYADDHPVSPLQTDERPKTLTTAEFKLHLELMEPYDSLSAVFKSVFNLHRYGLTLQEQISA